MVNTVERKSSRNGQRFSAERSQPLGIGLVEAQAFADAYAFLSIGLKLPSSGLADLLREGHVVETVASMAADLGGPSNQLAERACELFLRSQGEEAAKLPALRAAYTALFTNPLGTKMHIHEAQFLYYQADPDADVGLSPRMFVNPSALSVERIVKKAGLERNGASNESADHIATEMELLSKLFAEKARLRHVAGPEGAATDEEIALDSVIREFSHYHCQKWHEAFFEQLSVSEVCDFFDGLGFWGLFVTRSLASL